MKLEAFRLIAPQIDKEVEAVFAKFGLKVDKRSASVDSLNGTVSFRLSLVDTNLKDKDGNATTPDAQFYRNNCTYIGLKPEWLNQEFKLGGRPAKLVGLKNRRSPFCVCVEIGGSIKLYKTDAIRQAFGMPRERSLDELRAAALASAR